MNINPDVSNESSTFLCNKMNGKNPSIKNHMFSDIIKAINLNHIECAESILRRSLITVQESKSVEIQTRVINDIIKDFLITTKSNLFKQNFQSINGLPEPCSV